VYCLPAVAVRGFGQAVGYEPDPQAFDLLQRNIERNGLGARVTAHNAALSAARSQLTLKLGTNNAGDNRIVAGVSADAVPGTVAVAAVSFDDEVACGHIPLDDLALAWIDVQGHELEVLNGARSLLAAGVPLVIGVRERDVRKRAAR